MNENPTLHDIQRLRARLTAMPDVEPSSDLTARIMSAVKQEQVRERHVRWYQRAAAAVAIIALSAWGLSTRHGDQPALAGHDAAPVMDTPGDGVQDALEWFCRSQEPDGSWSPARWGGDARFEVALTALPLLALQSSSQEKSPRQQEVAEKAKRYLLSHCDAQGRFGPAFYGSSYTQAMATLALLSRYREMPDADTKRVLQRALDVIVSQQQPAGSWGIAGAAQPDLTVTWWQVETLKLAATLGWEDVRPHISLGTKWLQAQPDPMPLHDAWDPRGKVDYFALYRATMRLHDAGQAAASDQLTSIRQVLLQKQVRDGEESGSWMPDDRWAAVGGRIYSTAMASLALR